MDFGKVVSFTNKSSKDFEHAYGGQPYFVKAGETKLYPYELAEHLAKHLARRMLLEKDTSATTFDPNDPTKGTGQALWNEETEKNLIDKLLGDPMTQTVEPPKSENEVILEKVTQLNTNLGETVPTVGYQDKKEVIDELNKRGIKFDARLTKVKLEDLLKGEAV